MSERHRVNPMNRKGKKTVTSPVSPALTEDCHSSTKSAVSGRARARTRDRGDTPKGVTPPCLFPESSDLTGVTVGLRGLRPTSSRPPEVPSPDPSAAAPPTGRHMDRTARVKALRRGIEKRRRTLERSMAYRPDPRPVDLERWARMRADIALFEHTLAEVLAGRNPPPSPRTGEKTRELPDMIGGDDHGQ
jgi:hypothetical protein